MPIDRDATLRNAEKLLREGKIDPAIAEYVRMVEEQPEDWTTANTLGDLYARVGQLENAVEQFVRIADGLSVQGFLPKAAAVYKKILKLKPDDERALLQSAEIAAGQGLYADARGYLNTLVENRKAAGDTKGAAQARIRIGGLDPSDYEARMTAAAARVEIGDTHGALSDLREIAGEAVEKGREMTAIEALKRAAKLAPEDDGLRAQLLDLYVAQGDIEHAREHATTVAELQALADALDLRGRHDEALEILNDAAWLDSNEPRDKADLARAFVTRGDTTTASEFLTLDMAGDDPRLQLTVAEIHLRAGRRDEGLAIVRQVLQRDGAQAPMVASTGWTLAEHSPEVGYPVVELAVDTMAARQEWVPAAAALQEFVTRVPNHVAGLMRLAETAVDGGLEPVLYTAQRQLADAYLAAGKGNEARAIAEDLVAREPWDRSNLERFRKALVLLHEPDPDAVIADRLAGDKPFTTTGPFYPAVKEPGLHTIDDMEIEVTAVVEDGPGSNADSEDLFEPPAEAAPPPDLDDVFAMIREEAAQGADTAAAAEYQRALSLREAGDVDGCIEALQTAARAPELRFVTASLLGRLYKERGSMLLALEWLERAVQAPAPTPDEYFSVLLELADGLESTGETARALAICLEIKAEAGSYRDVEQRVDRLARAQG